MSDIIQEEDPYNEYLDILDENAEEEESLFDLDEFEE